MGKSPRYFLLFFKDFSARSSVVEHPPFKREAVSSSLTERKGFGSCFKSLYAPFVYRLGHQIFNLVRGVRFSQGAFFCFGFCVYRVLQPRSDTSACRPFTVYSSSVAPTLNAKSLQKSQCSNFNFFQTSDTLDCHPLVVYFARQAFSKIKIFDKKFLLFQIRILLKNPRKRCVLLGIKIRSKILAKLPYIPLPSLFPIFSPLPLVEGENKRGGGKIDNTYFYTPPLTPPLFYEKGRGIEESTTLIFYFIKKSGEGNKIKPFFE